MPRRGEKVAGNNKNKHACNIKMRKMVKNNNKNKLNKNDKMNS